MSDHTFEVEHFDIYAAPKGKPKQMRKSSTEWSKDNAQEAVWNLLKNGCTVRMVTKNETISRWD